MKWIVKIAYLFGSILFIIWLHLGEQRREVPEPGARVVMEKWHRWDHFWYPVAVFQGFSDQGGADGNLNLKYCKAAVSSWKLGGAKGLLGREIYRCRDQSSWAAFWQWSRDKTEPDTSILKMNRVDVLPD